MEIPENLKTVDGTVAAMREAAKRLLESTGSDEGFSYMADLLEAAMKRERDLASLRAIHAVEMAERDARREPVPVVSRETQSAAHNAACVCQTAHDTAKLREALEKIAAWGPDPFIEPVNGDSSAIYENARSDENGKFLGREIPAWWGVAWRNDLKEFVALAKAALAATPRNCDRGRDAAEDAFTARFGRPWTAEEARVAEWLFEEEGRTGAARQDADGAETGGER